MSAALSVNSWRQLNVEESKEKESTTEGMFFAVMSEVCSVKNQRVYPIDQTWKAGYMYMAVVVRFHCSEPTFDNHASEK